MLHPCDAWLMLQAHGPAADPAWLAVLPVTRDHQVPAGRGGLRQHRPPFLRDVRCLCLWVVQHL